MFGVANTCIGECNMPEHLRSSDFSTPCRCSGVCGGARARSRAFPEKGLKVKYLFVALIDIY